MSPNKNHEESLLKRLARSRAMNSRNVSRDASMSPTRCEVPSGGGGGGQYVQYIPYSFILPNYGGVSVSLPVLDDPSFQPYTHLAQPVFPQRKLSRLSNLVWTTSVSQPDLTQVVTTPTVSPASSHPASRACSPAPVEARTDQVWSCSTLGNRSNSLSPSRRVIPSTKPCARIAPHKVTERDAVTKIGHVQSADQALIRNSSPAPTFRANEFRPSNSPLATTATTAMPWPSSGNIVTHSGYNLSPGERWKDGSVPNGNLSQFNSLRRSIGTSCTDLANTPTPPFIVETCQICSLFYPKVTRTVEESSKGSPHFVYSPCLHGHQVVLKSGDRNSNTQLTSKNPNEADNAPVKSPDKKLGMEKMKR